VAATQRTVAWDPGTYAGSVDVDVSIDGGATWSPLDEGIPNDGSEVVSLPDFEGDAVRVRVRAPGGAPADASDADFSLARVRLAPAPLGITGAAGSLVVGDVDADGDLDLAISTVFDEVRVYGNDGTGDFAIASSVPDADEVGLDWADHDGDGDLDLALVGSDADHAPNAAVYRRAADGTFADLGTSIAGGVRGAVAWGDYDADGDPDLAVAPEGQPTRVYRNDGAGTFADVGAVLVATTAGGVSWGDADGDGDLDLAVAGGGATRVYRNDAGAFVESAVALVDVWAADLAWADYDADGDLDLALCGYSDSVGAPVSRIYRNDGDERFVDAGASLEGLFGGGVSWGDHDADGDLDLVVTGATSPALTPGGRVYRNDREAGFADAGLPVAGGWLSRPVWGDVDGDGDLDVATLTGTGGTFVVAFRNSRVP
jgi:hypothetical protein